VFLLPSGSPNLELNVVNLAVYNLFLFNINQILTPMTIFLCRILLQPYQHNNIKYHALLGNCDFCKVKYLKGSLLLFKLLKTDARAFLICLDLKLGEMRVRGPL
jgi:phosphatidylinositol kinase/protein kinase (PI-3  family)